MPSSPRLNIPYLAPQQAQKHVTVNEALRRLDALAQLRILCRKSQTQPGAPAEGDSYILPAGASGGQWSTMAENDIATYQDGAWTKIAPQDGWRAWVESENALIVFTPAGWRLIVRETLTSDRTYYVDTAAGADANDGLSPTTAFATIQRAVDAAAALDSSIYDVLISVADGTYTEEVIVKKLLGTGALTIRGNLASPSSCIVQPPGSGICFKGESTCIGTICYVEGFKCAGASSFIHISWQGGGSRLFIRNIIFAEGGTFAKVASQVNALVWWRNGDIEVTHGGGHFVYAALKGLFITSGAGAVMTLTGTPNWSIAFIQAKQYAQVSFGGLPTFSGDATGKRYDVKEFALVDSSGGGVNAFPGDANGSVSSATYGLYL